MNRNPSFISEKLPEIRKATWYRQRFDACPHFMFFLGDAHISEVQHTKYPFGQRIAYAGFSKNRADWYHSLPELEYTASHIIEAAQKNPYVSEQMIKDFLPWQEKFYAECGRLRELNLSALSNDELLAEYSALADVYTKKLNSSPLIDGFALSTDAMIAEKVKEYLEKQGEGEKFVEYFSTLTAATFISFLQAEELALLDVAEVVKNDPSQEPELLARHQAAYFWMQNNYVKDHVLDFDFFAQRLTELKTLDIAARRAELLVLPVEHQEKKAELMNLLRVPDDIRILLKITDDFNAWQDERKKGTFWATHYFSVLLEEFARRTDYTVEELKYAFPPEMGDVLSKKLSREELQQRFQYCIILWGLDTYDVTTDQKLIEDLDRIGTGAVDTAAELKGFAAQLGKVRGPVKILLSADESPKIEDGDILVAVMTRPDYLAAMKKAAAFVTDEGGITCHAAIVARELKKPCIVGTKVATKVLKDGDMVEVDADRGVVKKV